MIGSMNTVGENCNRRMHLSRVCCVRGCTDKFKRIGPLFSFPKDKTERDIWMDLCGFPKENRHLLPKYMYACQLHFKVSFPGQRVLYKGTRPTLNLPELSTFADSAERNETPVVDGCRTGVSSKEVLSTITKSCNKTITEEHSLKEVDMKQAGSKVGATLSKEENLFKSKAICSDENESQNCSYYETSEEKMPNEIVISTQSLRRGHRKVCCVRGCKLKKFPGDGIFFFSVPKDKAEREIWKNLCGISKAYRQQLPRKLFVCQSHFKLGYPGQMKLYQGTRPTLNLPDPSILTEETSDTYSLFDNKETEDNSLFSDKIPSEEINVSQADSKENEVLVASDNFDCVEDFSSTLFTKSKNSTTKTEMHKDRTNENESQNCSYCKTSNERISYYLGEIEKLRKECFEISTENILLENELQKITKNILNLRNEFEIQTSLML